MEIKKIDLDFSVCKVEDFSQVNFDDEFIFVGKTDEELSLVCNSEFVPKNILECETGWKCFRIQGVLDFSLWNPVFAFLPIESRIHAFQEIIFQTKPQSDFFNTKRTPATISTLIISKQVFFYGVDVRWR